MPNMADRKNDPLVRALLIGDSGGGKTGALTSLVATGYNLFIADFDNGLDVLASLVRRQVPDRLSQIEYETFRDKHKVMGDKLVPLDASAWTKGIRYIEKITQMKDLSGNDVLVIDSLSFAAKAALAHILKMNGRLTMAPYQSDYGEAQKLVEGLVALLTDPAISCNVICTAHVNYQGDEEAGVPTKGLPAMIGKAINPIIPRYFNHTLLARQIGAEGALKRYIHTQTFGNIELKNTNPGVIKSRYPLETGLADYFFDARGVEPEEAAAA
jgi:AAA domain